MWRRVDVLLDDSEYRDLEQAARRPGLTVAQWIREAVRAMRHKEPPADTARKLAAVREALQHSYPAPDINQMLAEVGRGFTS